MKGGAAAKVVSALGVGAVLLIASVASAQSYDPYYQQQYQPSSSYYGGGYNYYDPYSYNYGYGDFSNCYWYNTCGYNNWYGWGGYNNWYGGGGYNNYYCYYYPWYPGCGGGGYGYGGAPSITSVTGPTSLNVGQQGTWSIMTNAQSNTYLSVSVRWGDENTYPYYGAYGTQVSQQNTFTHTYRQAGVYTITFTATDQYGRSNTATATVDVRNTNTNPQCWYDQYAGRWICY